MFSHVTLGASDLERAAAFYEPLLGALGLELKFRGDELVAWKEPGRDRPLFVIARPFDGEAATVGNGQMTAFLAPSRSAVDRCHAMALAAGGADEGAPGLRPRYHPTYYGAYFRDPDGNKLCVCCHEPE